MRRLIAVLTLLLIATPAFANSYQNIQGNSQSTQSRRSPDQTLIDTTTTTTTLGLPVYTGVAPKGAATTDSDWFVCKAVEAANVTTVNCAYGAWTDRASLTYA